MVDLLEPRVEVLQVRVTTSELEGLKKIAQGRGLTVAGLVRAWIAENGVQQFVTGTSTAQKLKKVERCRHGIDEGGRCFRCPGEVAKP